MAIGEVGDGGKESEIKSIYAGLPGDLLDECHPEIIE